MNIIYYDTNHQRRNKNAGLMARAVKDITVISVGTLRDVVSSGATTLIAAGDYMAVFLNSAGVENFTDPLETAVLKSMEQNPEGVPPIVLFGDSAALDKLVQEYRIRVIGTAPNGYLEERHIPEILAAINGFSA
ncbi:hypothetical protein HYU09_01200 [Candidatus Woesearchaeota archaeon]|nr:hypothetical protein [Candidatus Woesearchaeota archaeon]